MNKTAKLITLAAAVLALFSSMGCDKLRARDQLNKGVESYKNNHYEQAIDHFQDAVRLDPGLINARMYLATAYVSQYIPGVDSPDNLRTAQQAIDEYQTALRIQPGYADAHDNLGLALTQTPGKMEDAIAEFRAAVSVNPGFAKAHNNLGRALSQIPGA